MKESQIQTAILNYLRKEFPTAIVWKLTEQTNCGIPDIIFIHAWNVVFFEVKSSSGSISPIQQSVIKRIKDNNISVEVVRSVEEVKNFLKIKRLDIK